MIAHKYSDNIVTICDVIVNIPDKIFKKKCPMQASVGHSYDFGGENHTCIHSLDHAYMKLNVMEAEVQFSMHLTTGEILGHVTL